VRVKVWDSPPRIEPEQMASPCFSRGIQWL
jgi:hypothetical protein